MRAITRAHAFLVRGRSLWDLLVIRDVSEGPGMERTLIVVAHLH